jgi:thiamine biosynthesis lipoprotein
MATYVTISVAAPETPEVLAAIDAAFAEIARLEKLLSEWQPDSEISAVNNAAGKQAVRVGPELFAVIESAQGVSEASGGAFDVTFAAFSGLWDFRSPRPSVPSEKARQARVGLVDFRKVELDEATRSVTLAKPGMKIGLGGIAKGFAVDGASRVLAANGYINHLIVAGGDLYASGRKKSRKWNVGVRSPDGRGLHATLEVENEGVATSGNYERFFIKNGVRYHHILDPKTGLPARGTSSATVLAKNAMLADAYATAAFALGPTRGVDLAERVGDLEVLIFDDEAYQPHVTAGLDARLVVVPKDAAEAVEPAAEGRERTAPEE